MQLHDRDDERQCDWCGWLSLDVWNVRCTNPKCGKPLRQSLNQELVEHGLVDPLTSTKQALPSKQRQAPRSDVVRKKIPWTRIVDDLSK